MTASAYLLFFDGGPQKRLNFAQHFLTGKRIHQLLLSVLFFSIGLLKSNLSTAQFSPDNCNNIQCTSNDVRVISAYLSGPNNTAINCGSTNPFENAELHLIVSSNTQRIGVSISGTLTADGNNYALGKCFTGEKLTMGRITT